MVRPEYSALLSRWLGAAQGKCDFLIRSAQPKEAAAGVYQLTACLASGSHLDIGVVHLHGCHSEVL